MNAANATGAVAMVRLRCKTCMRRHDFPVPLGDPTRLTREIESWQYKHPPAEGHVILLPLVRVFMPRDFDDSAFDARGYAPWWHPHSGRKFRENTNYQTSFVASAALTVTSWATLASDSALLAGASSAVEDEGATGAALELSVSAALKGGTTPTTAKEFDIYAWTKTDDSTYPDTITGSDAAITISTAQALNTALRLAMRFDSSTTTGATYPTGWYTMGMVPVDCLFGMLPRYWGLFLTHSSVAAMASGSYAKKKGLYVQS